MIILSLQFLTDIYNTAMEHPELAGAACAMLLGVNLLLIAEPL